MDFRNKYLKYTPEITFDIFQKVWDKLIESGYLPFDKYDVERGFGDFKTLYNYLRIAENHPMVFNCYSFVADSFSETTVQEILGYDPFVKDDDFVLPEKWYVLVTNETVKDINIFKSKTSWKDKAIDYKAVGYEGVGYNSPPNDYTEITFDQFKKYVLKQDVEESKEVIPEYVECISWFGNSFTPSKIYKVVNGKVKDNDGYHKITDWNHVDFKPSTKSAFDAQNQPKQPIKQAVHCETQEHEFLAQMFGGKVSKVNKVQISTDNEIKINIIQKQSIKI